MQILSHGCDETCAVRYKPRGIGASATSVEIMPVRTMRCDGKTQTTTFVYTFLPQ